jgi:hypothetical protein
MLDYVYEPLPPESAIVDGALAFHGTILVVVNVVELLVGGTCDGGCLVLDLPLQLEELHGVQADDARVGGNLGGVLVEVVVHAECANCGGGGGRRGRAHNDLRRSWRWW